MGSLDAYGLRGAKTKGFLFERLCLDPSKLGRQAFTIIVDFRFQSFLALAHKVLNFACRAALGWVMFSIWATAIP